MYAAQSFTQRVSATCGATRRRQMRDERDGGDASRDLRAFSAIHIQHATDPNSLGSNTRVCSRIHIQAHSHKSAAWHTDTTAGGAV